MSAVYQLLEVSLATFGTLHNQRADSSFDRHMLWAVGELEGEIHTLICQHDRPHIVIGKIRQIHSVLPFSPTVPLT